MDPAVAFGKVLRKLRREAQFTQEQLGFECDLQRVYISLLELGQKQPSLTTIIKLARGLRLAPAELMVLVDAELSKGRRKG